MPRSREEKQVICGYNNMPLTKSQLFVQSHSVNLSTKNRVLFFAKKWNSKVEAVSVNIPYW